jgi:uncharacterized caspase-like protein
MCYVSLVASIFYTGFGMKFESQNIFFLFTASRSLVPVFKKNTTVCVRERTIPTERPPFVGEVSANFYGKRGVTWSA